MLSVPPPNRGLPGVVATPRAVVDRIFWWAVALRRTVFGSSRMAWVMDPFLMNRVQVLRDPRGALVAGGLAGEPPDIGGDADRGDRGRAAEGPERALGADRGAVRDRGHPHQGRPLGGVLGRGDVHPHSGLEMDADGLRRVGDVADGQQVTDAVEEDVRCYLAAVGHRSYWPREGQRLADEVQLQEVVRRDGLGQLGRRADVGPEDLVESMAVERAGERGQWS